MTAFSELGHARLHHYYQQMMGLRSDALTSDDPEAIHKMRVAARRLRVVLKTFADCYPQKPAKRLTRRVKRLQRALGKVRDADVLTAQLQSDEEHAPATQRPGIRWLINHLQAQRTADFQVVQRRLRKRKVARVEADFQATLRPRDPLDRPPDIQQPEGADSAALQPENSIAAHLQPLLFARLAELRRWSDVARNPDASQEQHQLRIAAKRLRYTLELFSDALPRQASEFIQALSELQDVLGALHDQIVLQGIMEQALTEPEQPEAEEAHPQGQERTALKRFLTAKSREHRARYAAFLLCWERWEAHHLLDQMDEFARALGPTLTEREICGGLNVEDWPHARQVARLSQTLFEETAALHQLDERSVVLLGRAALLHNAGMLIEKRSHHKHSFELISAASLPDVSATERREIACIARYHRRALPSLRHPEFASLDKAARERVSQLAALVRLADACDYHHDGRVEHVQLELDGDEARLWLTPSPGLHADEEIRQAQAKADLFEQVFERKIQVAEVESAQEK
ncbi:MAG TPA: CHAD domain-containing protein [Ktedonobacterales bacterium]|jgi:exopolyphosphatase/guanosine-5'-triphosphate,3'-diphosphate pyrophosphatase